MIEIITSLQNTNIKLAASLKQKKYRDEKKLFIVEGIRLSEDAIKSNWQIQQCFCTDEALQNTRVQKILGQLEEMNCRIYKVSKSIYDKLSETKEPQGLLLIVGTQYGNLAACMVKDRPPMLIVLDCLQDPGNVGTIIRTAEAAGCTGVVMTKGSADVFSGKTVRATMGAIFRIPIATGVEYRELLDFIKKEKILLYVTALDSTAKQYFSVDFTKSTVVVFGNEGNGVSDILLSAAENKVYIPMLGEAESLNVSAATAIVSYESLRQRNFKSF